MKKLVCELCGGNEFTKRDGLWVCNYCRTSYTPDEAKKIMVETATVMIDRSQEIENYRKLAERSAEDGDFSRAVKYYDKILEADPDDWAASFNRSATKAKMLTLSNYEKIYEVAVAVERAITIINETKNPEEAYSERQLLALRLGEHVLEILDEFESKLWLARSLMNLLYYQDATTWCLKFADDSLSIYEDAKNQNFVDNENPVNGENSREAKEFRMMHLAENFATRCVSIAETNQYEENDAYGIPTTLTAEMDDAQKAYIKGKCDRFVEFVRKHGNPEFTVTLPEPQKPAEPEKPQKSGCYIATAVYRSDNCPEVRTLRRFRDECLSNHMAGRWFVRLYYAISPTLVKILGDTKGFSFLIKPVLDRFSAYLKRKGF